MCIWDPNYVNIPLEVNRLFLHITFVYSKQPEHRAESELLYPIKNTTYTHSNH